MDVAGNSPLGHFGDNPVAFLRVRSGNPGEIEVSRASEIRTGVLQMSQRKLFRHLIVAADQGMPALDHARITVQLPEADGGHDIGHVAFVPGRDDIIFPGTGVFLSERVF